MNELFVFAFAISAATVVAVSGSDTPITPIPKECPKSNVGKAVYIAHKEDCTKFYACNSGQPRLMSCPFMENKKRLHFNPLLQVCDWPWHAGCAHPPKPKPTTTTTKPTTTTTKPTTTTAKPTTTTAKPTTTTTKPTTTTTKPTTTTTKPTTTTTKPTTTTTKPTTTTAKPTTITTKPTTTTAKSTTTTTKPIITTECPKGPGAAGVKVPHENDCTLYYECHEDGKKTLEKCLEELVFLPSIGMCDWDDGTVCNHVP